MPRSLPTLVLLPAGSGPHPLLLFLHGFRTTPLTYGRLLEGWARAGFVVAAPWLPGERADAVGAPVEADLSNEPADGSFVISRLLALSGSAGSALHGAIAGGRVAVSGHSDGGEAAFAMGFVPGYTDERLRAVVSLSGGTVTAAGLVDDARTRARALMLVQGTADPIHPVATAVATAEAVPGPHRLLLLSGAGHLAPFTDPGPLFRRVLAQTTAFLRRHLG